MGETLSEYDEWYVILELRISALSSTNLKNYFLTLTAGFVGVVTYTYYTYNSSHHWHQHSQSIHHTQTCLLCIHHYHNGIGHDHKLVKILWVMGGLIDDDNMC